MIGVGQQLGGYTILKRIGHGGLGEVYLAQHRRVARRAAVKVLLPELSQKAAVLEQFFKEARNTSLIKHPGIVEILDCDLVDGQAFIIMEFLDGESLGGYLRRTGTLEHDLAFLLGAVAAAASAVGAAHVAGIMHRDLKPENIYLHLSAATDPTVTVKVLDFGIAKLSREDGGPSQTGSGMWLGSPTYMSPEQCRGVGRPDARSDIYSLGCVLYEALCGRPPFVDQGMADLIAAHVSQPPKPPIKFVPGLLPKLNSFILRMLAKKPEDRPQTMIQVIGTLRDCARAVGIDVDGQMQPMNPVERPTNMFGPAPETAPVRPVAQKPPAPVDAETLAANSIEPPSESRPATAEERPRPLRVILPPMPEGFPAGEIPLRPAAPPLGVGAGPPLDPRPTLPAPRVRTLELGAEPGQAALPGPANEQPLRGFVGGTLLLEPPVDQARQSPIRAVAGGTMMMDRSDRPDDKGPEEPHEDRSDEAADEPWTGSAPVSKTWLHRIPAAFGEKKGRLLAIVGSAGVLVAGVTIMIASTGTEQRLRPRRPNNPSTQRDRAAPDSMLAGKAPPIATTTTPPLEPTAARLATIQIDIQGLAPRTIITVDDQLATLPIRIPRGPELHRIGLRSPTGRERTIEIDGTRDRAIELLVERPAPPSNPTAPKQDNRDQTSEKDSGRKTQGPGRDRGGPAGKKPATPKDDIKAITDI